MSGTPRGEHKSSGSVEDRLKSVSLDSRKLPDTSNHSVVLSVWSFCVFFLASCYSTFTFKKRRLLAFIRDQTNFSKSLNNQAKPAIICTIACQCSDLIGDLVGGVA